MEEELNQRKSNEEEKGEDKILTTSTKFDMAQELQESIEQNLLTEEYEENKKKRKDEGESKESRQHNSYSTPTINAQVLYEVYKNRHSPSYQDVEVVLYSYQVPWFATAMTDGNKIWFGPRGEFYDPHPNDRLYHELSHWRISTPYGTELDAETMAQLQMPRLNAVNITYKI